MSSQSYPGASPPSGGSAEGGWGDGSTGGGPPSLETIASMALGGDKGKNLGPLIVGLALDSLCFGIVIHQFLYWISNAKGEKRHIRYLLYWAVFMTVVTTFFSWAWVFHLYVYNFGTYAEFMTFKWMSWYGILDPLIITAVQVCFAERAYLLCGRSKTLLAVIGFFLVTSIAGGIGETIIMFPFYYLDTNIVVSVFFWIWPSAATAADLLLTTSITWGLLRCKTGWSDTDALIKKLVILSIEAQLPGTLVAIAFLIQFSIDDHSYNNAFFQMIYGKPYLMGFLAVLNSKESWKKDGTSSSGRNNVYNLEKSSRDRAYQGTVIIGVNAETATELQRADTMQVGLNRQDTEAGSIKAEGSIAETEEGQRVFEYQHGRRDSGLAFNAV